MASYVKIIINNACIILQLFSLRTYEIDWFRYPEIDI